GCEPDNTAFAGERSRHVQIARYIKRQSLWASEAAEKRRNAAVGIDLVHGIKAGGRGAVNKQVSVGTTCQVVSEHAGLDGGENKNLPVFANLENRAAAVADVKIFR